MDWIKDISQRIENENLDLNHLLAELKNRVNDQFNLSIEEEVQFL